MKENQRRPRGESAWRIFREVFECCGKIYAATEPKRGAGKIHRAKLWREASTANKGMTSVNDYC